MLELPFGGSRRAQCVTDGAAEENDTVP